MWRSWAALAWNDHTVNRLQLSLAVLGMLLLGWGYWLAHSGRPDAHKKWRDRALAVLGLLGALAYPNFGWLHFPNSNFVHAWDTYHYYLGAKYFPELGYELLYDCTVVADAEAGGARLAHAKRRIITDLRTNEMVRTTEVLAHPERCKASFSPERWSAFEKDVDFFRARESTDRWEKIQHDHGYNATPVWTALGYLLTNLGPASTPQVVALNLFDPLYLMLMALLVWWAFGWRVAAVAMLVFGTHFPNRFYWTGGAFLRHDWLFYLVACVCLLKKERFFLAGLSIAYATVLRLFPAFVVVGPAFAAVDVLWRERRVDRRWLTFFAGGALGVLLLSTLAAPLSGGFSTYRAFAKNTSKHANTPLTNHMGLRTALSYRPSTIGALMRDGKTFDPWKKWKDARLEAFHSALPLYVAIALGFAVLLYFAIRGAGNEPWMAAALSTGMIAVGAELTCYYYGFVVAIATLWLKKREVGLLLLTLCGVTHFIHWAPFPNMSGWDDEKYVAMSFAALVAFGGVMWAFTPHAEKYCLPEEGLALTPAAPVTKTRTNER
ncbi:MAG: hypothetical protein ACOZIN_08755 [Myxococcota bacterium]